MADPRCVHYQFAHVALRGLVFNEPRLALALWELEEPGALLDEIAVQVARACRAEGQGGELQAAQLEVHKCRLGSNPCVIIKLPEPIASTEAYMVAIIALRDLDRAPGREAVACRYFTLEYSDQREAPHTVIGEWTEQGDHLNMGAGPEPKVAAFVGELVRFLAA